jgi:centrosomal protein CEP120
MSLSKLTSTITNDCLVVEMWQKDYENVQLGKCLIDLSKVLKSIKQNQEHHEKLMYIQTVELTVPIISNDEENIGILRVILALEDLGQIYGLQAEIPSNEPVINSKIDKYISDDIHETQEYKFALDLELWKEEEEAKFRTSLLEKEQLLCKKFASEWKAREQIREESLYRKLENYKSLESQLDNLSTQLEQREQSLINAESLFEIRRQNLESECQKTINDSRQASRILSDNFAHKLESERQKTIDVIQTMKKHEVEKDAVLKRYKALDDEFHEYRKQTHSGDIIQISQQLSASLMKNNELILTLEARNVKLASNKSKLAKLHQAYTALKSKIQNDEKQKQILQNKEIMGLQQRLSAATQLSNLKENKREISNVKSILQELKENVIPKDSSKNKSQLAHLYRERESLLNSGF